MMTDPEKDYLLGRIQDLERTNRRWKAAALAAVSALVLVFVATSLSTVFWHFRAEEGRWEALREREAAEAARQEALMQQILAEERLLRTRRERP